MRRVQTDTELNGVRYQASETVGRMFMASGGSKPTSMSRKCGCGLCWGVCVPRWLTLGLLALIAGLGTTTTEAYRMRSYDQQYGGRDLQVGM